MTTCLGKSCSFGLPRVASAFRKLLSIYVFSYFPFGFEVRVWDLIVSVPDHCLSFYFGMLIFLLLNALPDSLITSAEDAEDCVAVHFSGES